MSRTTGSYGPRTLDAIRRAGLRLVFEHGYEAMSLRQLAAEVGIQAGSLYNHISTKQDLLVMLVQDHMKELLGELDAALDPAADSIEQLRRFIRFHVTYHMAKKKEVSVGNFELRALEPRNYAAVIRMRRAYEQRLIDIIEAGSKEGVLDLADAQIAAYAILAMLTGVCTWYKPSGRLSKEAIVALHEKLVMDGVLARTQLTKASQVEKPRRRSRTSRA